LIVKEAYNSVINKNHSRIHSWNQPVHAILSLSFVFSEICIHQNRILPSKTITAEVPFLTL